MVFAQGRHLPQQLPMLSWLRTWCSDSAPDAIALRMALSDTLWQMQTIIAELDPGKLRAGLELLSFCKCEQFLFRLLAILQRLASGSWKIV